MAKNRGAEYWRGRLEREHPDIAERLAAGEIASVRAACIEAGLIRQATGVDELRRAWTRASVKQRNTFLASVAPGMAAGNLMDPGAAAEQFMAAFAGVDELPEMPEEDFEAEKMRLLLAHQPVETFTRAYMDEDSRRTMRYCREIQTQIDANNAAMVAEVRDEMAKARMKARGLAKATGIAVTTLSQLLDNGIRISNQHYDTLRAWLADRRAGSKYAEVGHV